MDLESQKDWNEYKVTSNAMKKAKQEAKQECRRKREAGEPISDNESSTSSSCISSGSANTERVRVLEEKLEKMQRLLMSMGVPNVEEYDPTARGSRAIKFARAA
jgi:hypothetical protein